MPVEIFRHANAVVPAGEQKSLRLQPGKTYADLAVAAAGNACRNAFVTSSRVEGISSATMNQLTAWHWPGNIRELDNVLARAVMLHRGGILNVPLISDESEAGAAEKPPQTMEDAERLHIEKMLRATGWILEGS